MPADRNPSDHDFADWIKPHIGRLVRISRAFALPADQHDLFQELMVTAWKAMPSFRGDSSAQTFIYRVAHNRALTWSKREGLNRLRLVSAVQEMSHAPPGDDSHEAARLEVLYVAIRQLPPVDRSLMLLSLEGASYADMAALHGLSETHVGARLSRARTRLTTLIQETPDGY